MVYTTAGTISGRFILKCNTFKGLRHFFGPFCQVFFAKKLKRYAKLHIFLNTIFLILMTLFLYNRGFQRNFLLHKKPASKPCRILHSAPVGSFSSYFSVLFPCFDRFYLLCDLLSFRNALVYQTPYPVERQQNWKLIYHRSITLTPLHIWKHTGYDIFTLGFRSEWFPI